MDDNRLIKKLNLSGIRGDGNMVNSGQKDANGRDISEMMTDPRYLRQSSALINESLQKGFDVLQLSDGSIVTTGTKTVVHHYRWDEEKGKLVRSKSETSGLSAVRRSRKSSQEETRNEAQDEIQGEDA